MEPEETALTTERVKGWLKQESIELGSERKQAHETNDWVSQEEQPKHFLWEEAVLKYMHRCLCVPLKLGAPHHAV